jgi:4-hydroxybenzoyl-CoA reductase subunit beta
VLTLPAFQYHQPRSLDEAVALLAAHAGKVKVIAGGTDLVPNMKHRLFTPDHVVGLTGIAGLRALFEDGEAMVIGPMVTLADIARNPQVKELFPSLARGAEHVAGPQLREMGTLGGNICLDTRCVYYNQTYFWRKALGYCLKKDGTVCHVVKGGQKCVAAASNDTAPVLMTLGATLRLKGPRGERLVPVTEFYVADGIANTVLEQDEILAEVRIPLPKGKWKFGYEKLRIRAAIDYPALTVATAVKLGAGEVIEDLRVCVSALGSRPHPVKRLEAFHGKALDAATVKELGLAAYRQCHPLTNINVDPAWRRELIPVLVRKALQA